MTEEQEECEEHEFDYFYEHNGIVYQVCRYCEYEEEAEEMEE